MRWSAWRCAQLINSLGSDEKHAEGRALAFAVFSWLLSFAPLSFVLCVYSLPLCSPVLSPSLLPPPLLFLACCFHPSFFLNAARLLDSVLHSSCFARSFAWLRARRLLSSSESSSSPIPPLCNSSPLGILPPISSSRWMQAPHCTFAAPHRRSDHDASTRFAFSVTGLYLRRDGVCDRLAFRSTSSRYIALGSLSCLVLVRLIMTAL